MCTEVATKKKRKRKKEPLPVNIKYGPTVQKNRPPFHLIKRNPYIELFSKMEFKRFSEFHFSGNRGMSAFAHKGLDANPKIGKFCEC